MIQENNSIAPVAASRQSSLPEQLPAVLMLTLFFVTYNISAVSFLAQGAPAGDAPLPLAGYVGRIGPLARTALLAALLLPGLFSLLPFTVVPWAGTPVLNTLQPFLWGFGLPVAQRLYFRHTEPGRQAVYFGIAMGAGHLCWSLLMPLVGAFVSTSSPAGAVPDRFLLFLNVTRAVTNCLFVLLVWRLLHAGGAAGANGPGGTEKNLPPLPGMGKKLVLLLLPFLLCFALSGLMNYKFFVRVQLRGEYTEFMHLALAALFPLLGLIFSRRKFGPAFPCLCAAVLCFALALLMSFPPFSARAGVALCIISQQTLFFLGVLFFSRFAPYSRCPALVLCLGWLVALAGIPGNLLGTRLLPALDIPIFPAVSVLAGLCAVSLIPLRRVFPLPEAPAQAEDTALEALSAESAKLEALRIEAETEAARLEAARMETLRIEAEAEAKRRAFAAAFALTTREAEVLDGILRGLEREAIGAELGISDRTVKFHIRGLLKKTGEANRSKLLHFYTAWQSG